MPSGRTGLDEPLTPRERRVRYHFATWILISAVILLVYLLDGISSRSAVAIVALAVVCCGVYSLSRCSNGGFWAPATLFLAVVGVFHLGLLANILTGIDPAFPRASDYQWYAGAPGVLALFLVTIGICSYVVSALLILCRRSGAGRRRSDDEALTLRISRAGAAVLLLGTAGWFVIASSRVGLGGLVGSYQSFLEATATSDINLTYLVIGVGLGLTMMSPLRGIAAPAVAMFGIFAAVGFFLGLRGEVLFPIAVAAGVLARRRRMPSAVLAVVASVLVLMMVSAAKQIRQVGLAQAGIDLSGATPLSALSELGSTLRVVATVAEWHSAGEAFRMGDTYTVSVTRFLEQFWGARVAAADDLRLFNVEIARRAGNIGGSVVGEAYHNFSVPGVVIAMCLLGVIFASFSRDRLSAVQTAVYVVVAVPLFNHIRNSFVPVIPAVLVGLVLLILVVLTRRRPAVEEPLIDRRGGTVANPTRVSFPAAD
jgi:hypothetical protein